MYWSRELLFLIGSLESHFADRFVAKLALMSTGAGRHISEW